MGLPEPSTLVDGTIPPPVSLNAVSGTSRGFTRDWFVRPYVLALLAVLAGAVARELAVVIRSHSILFQLTIDPKAANSFTPLFAADQVFCFFLMGLLGDPRDRTKVETAIRILGAVLLGEIFVLAWRAGFKVYEFPRTVSLVALALNAAFSLIVVFVARRAAFRPLKVLVVGWDAGQAHAVQEKLAGSARLSGGLVTCKVLGPSELEGRLADSQIFSGAGDFDELILVQADQRQDLLLPVLCLLDRTPAPRVFVVPTLYDVVAMGRTDGPVAHDVRMVPIRSLLEQWDYAVLKRGMDLVIAGGLLVVLSPVLLATALLLRITQGAPVFYFQTRIGRKGRTFRICKFRTMRLDAERESGPVLAKKDDPRVTGLGRLLRTMRLDELPQLFNVLLGSMSLIGPRPERPEIAGQFGGDLPSYQLRHRVRPGLTGLAQVHATYESAPADKLRFDLSYIYGYSVLLDLALIGRTILVLFTVPGR